MSRPVDLAVYGHVLQVPLQVAGRRTARFSFQSICGRAYGPADYIELARIYHVIFIDDIPKLDLSHKNEVSVVLCSTPCVPSSSSVMCFICTGAALDHPDRRTLRTQGVGDGAGRCSHHGFVLGRPRARAPQRRQVPPFCSSSGRVHCGKG